jgi:hypothetical protein
MRLLLFVPIAALVAGCGKPPPPAVDPDEAGRQLKMALDAWKGQEPYGALESRSPPVVFNEPLWRGGTRLLDYELGPVELHGRQGRCTAKLTLEEIGGQRRERNIGYQIDTTPAVVIVREGLGP